MRIMNEVTVAQGRLVYRQTESVVESVTAYGIMISTTLFGNEETEHIEFISTDSEFVSNLLYILADNTVLPSTMVEIIADYVAEYHTVCC